MEVKSKAIVFIVILELTVLGILHGLVVKRFEQHEHRALENTVSWLAIQAESEVAGNGFERHSDLLTSAVESGLISYARLTTAAQTVFEVGQVGIDSDTLIELAWIEESQLFIQPLAEKGPGFVRGVTGYFIGLGLLIVIISAMLGLEIQRLFSRQLERFNTAVQKLSKGDLDHRMMVVEFSEISGIAKSFNAMAVRWQEKEASLLETRDQANRASKIKSEFLANMSHEIRTPMNAIIGMTHLAKQSNRDIRQANYLNKIEQASRTLLTLINDVLDFSKIEADRMQLESAPFYLRDVCNRFSGILQLEARRKGIEILFDIAPDVPCQMLGDSARLAQILLNLGNNALKFTERGEVVLRVSVESHMGDDVMLHFSIADSGIGLSEVQQENLFDSFTQADSSITRRYGGSGLGLAICKRLVGLMGGAIWVESEPSVGSVFHFTMTTVAVSVATSCQQTKKISELFGKQALVVEENDETKRILITRLREFGIEVDAFDTAVSAYDYLLHTGGKEQHYDFLFFEWREEELRHTESLEKLVFAAKGRIGRVIPITVHERSLVARALGQHGMDYSGVLSKPFLPIDIQEVLSNSGVCQSCHYVNTDSAASAQVAASVLLRGAHVLLAEDNELNQDVAVELLRSNGIKVDVVNNGRDAIDKLRINHYDGVLMDCQMPILDGYTATRMIRKIPSCAELPIIAMTASVFESDRAEMLEVGMNDYVSKPVDVDTLFEVMARWIKPPESIDDAIDMPKEMAELSAESLPIYQDRVFEHLDTDVGIAVVSGNVKAYRMLLGKFSKTQSRCLEDFNAALSSGSHDVAVRIVHTLRSTAGNIGAVQLKLLAAEAETYLRSEADVKIYPHIALMEAEMEGVIREINQLLERESIAV